MGAYGQIGEKCVIFESLLYVSTQMTLRGEYSAVNSNDNDGEMCAKSLFLEPGGLWGKTKVKYYTENVINPLRHGRLYQINTASVS